MKSLLKRTNELPDDLRDETGMDWWIVEHQGKPYSCSAFALANGLLWYHLGKKAMDISEYPLLRKRATEFMKMPSIRFLWLAAKEFDEQVVYPTTFLENQSCSLKSALRILRKYGCLSESQYGYNDISISDEALKDATVGRIYLNASIRRINAYINLEPAEPELRGAAKKDRHFENIQFWLKNVGPVAIRINLTPEFTKAGKNDYQLDGIPTTTDGSHALCVIGTKNDSEYFILRNSWGDNWGLDGHIHIHRDYLEYILKESYGIII